MKLKHSFLEFVQRDFSDRLLTASEEYLKVNQGLVEEGAHHYDNYEEIELWLMISCSGNLDKKLEDFRINSTGLRKIHLYLDSCILRIPLRNCMMKKRK